MAESQWRLLVRHPPLTCQYINCLQDTRTIAMKDQISAFKGKVTSLKINASKRKSHVTWELMASTSILFLSATKTPQREKEKCTKT